MALTKVGKNFAVGGPEPHRGCSAGTRAEVSGVTVVEDIIDNCHQGTARHILKKPSLDKVVSEFAGQARDTREFMDELAELERRRGGQG